MSGRLAVYGGSERRTGGAGPAPCQGCESCQRCKRELLACADFDFYVVTNRIARRAGYRQRGDAIGRGMKTPEGHNSDWRNEPEDS